MAACGTGTEDGPTGLDEVTEYQIAMTEIPTITELMKDNSGSQSSFPWRTIRVKKDGTTEVDFHFDSDSERVFAMEQNQGHYESVEALMSRVNTILGQDTNSQASVAKIFQSGSWVLVNVDDPDDPYIVPSTGDLLRDLISDENGNVYIGNEVLPLAAKSVKGSRSVMLSDGNITAELKAFKNDYDAYLARYFSIGGEIENYKEDGEGSDWWVGWCTWYPCIKTRTVEADRMFLSNRYFVDVAEGAGKVYYQADQHSRSEKNTDELELKHSGFSVGGGYDGSGDISGVQENPLDPSVFDAVCVFGTIENGRYSASAVVQSTSSDLPCNEPW